MAQVRCLLVVKKVAAGYLASAWSHGGGYVPAMMAGRTAFESLLQDWKKTG